VIQVHIVNLVGVLLHNFHTSSANATVKFWPSFSLKQHTNLNTSQGINNCTNTLFLQWYRMRKQPNTARILKKKLRLTLNFAHFRVGMIVIAQRCLGILVSYYTSMQVNPTSIESRFPFCKE
jgi:glutathione synthase/RimK-type ligase-like ATP-grasp enzyme